jgi:hypothetical protein
MHYSRQTPYFFEADGRVANRCCTSPLRELSVKRPAL